MKKLFIVFILLSFFNVHTINAQISFISELEEKMVLDWDNFFKNNPKSTRHFFISEVSDSSKWIEYELLFQKTIAEINSKIKKRHKSKKRAEIAYDHLHDQLFIKYLTNSTIEGLRLNKEYNCVTATAMFIDFADKLNFPYKIYETPTHIYPSLIINDKEIIIELTVPKHGFDFQLQEELSIDFLLENELITKDELFLKGEKAIYSEYIEETKEISRKELVAIQYYNSSIYAFEKKDYISSLNQLKKALILYQNSDFYINFGYTLTNIEFYSEYTDDQKLDILEDSYKFGTKDSILYLILTDITSNQIKNLVTENNEYEVAISLIDSLKSNTFPKHNNTKTISELGHFIHLKKAENLTSKGKLKEAIEALNIALDLKTSPNLIDFSIRLKNDRAIQLAQNSQFEEALEILNELKDRVDVYNEYPIILTTYTGVLLTSLREIEINEENSEILILKITEAYELQPNNFYVKTTISNIFHELAMEQVRLSDYKKAKAFISKGLALIGSDKDLEIDLKLINDMLVID